MYSHFKTTLLYGWRTTNFVGSKLARSLKLKPRLMISFKLFKAYGTILMGEMYNRSEQLQTWIGKGRHVTPRAEMKFQAQLKAAQEYSPVFSSDGIAYVPPVTHPL